ncbi:chitin recognition protein [Diplocarpon rosae]|nr:chitin recognition protein [Diplocarpon rosae]
MKFIILGLPALALALYAPSIFDEPLNPLCVVYAVVERPVVISTCFPSSTVATFDGYTTTVSSASCVDTTVTKSSTVEPLATKVEEPIAYTTLTTDTYTTFCAEPTTFTYGAKTFTVTEPTTITVTDCPCTYSVPMSDYTEYTTITTDILTTICPSPTVITQGTHTYTITEATTLTLTGVTTPFIQPPASSDNVPSPSVMAPTTMPEVISSPQSTDSVPPSKITSGQLPVTSGGVILESTVTIDSLTFLTPASLLPDSSVLSSLVPTVPPQEYSSSGPQSATTTALMEPSFTPGTPVAATSTYVSPILLVGSTELPVLSTDSVGISSSLVTPLVGSTLSITLPIPTPGLCGERGNGASCQDSGFGNCCGSDDTCGHDAAHCGTGCQPGFGYCTVISNDGTCGNGVSCIGSSFGACCSEFYNCGNETAFCGTGCRPGFGSCGIGQSATTVSSPSSTLSSTFDSLPSATVPPSCGLAYDIGEMPPSIGNTSLTSIPAPAVFTYLGNQYSFGFTGTSPDDKAYAVNNPEAPATDLLAYYEVPLDMMPSVFSCTSFGYLYHQDSGLCVTANATSTTGPRFQGSELLLEPCGLCSGGKPGQYIALWATLSLSEPGSPELFSYVYGNEC